MAEPRKRWIVEVTIARVGDRFRVVARRGGDLPELTYEPELHFAVVKALADDVREATADGVAIGPMVRARGDRICHALLGDLLHDIAPMVGEPRLRLLLQLEAPELHFVPWRQLSWPSFGVLTAKVVNPSRGLDFSPPRRPPGPPRDESALRESRVAVALLLESFSGSASGTRSGSGEDGKVLGSFDLREFLLPKARGTLYPHVTSTPADGIEPDHMVTFVLRLEPTGPSNISPFDIDFPASTPTVRLRATVSADAFARPEGESWERVFVVDRRLTTTPAEWEFRAKALGDQPSYALTVSFDVGDTPAGAYELRLRRKDAPELPAGAAGGLVSIPREAGGAGHVIKITSEGSQFRMRLRRGGGLVADALWPMSTELFFTNLEGARGLPDLWRFGAALHASLPAEITDALDNPTLQGLPLLIASGTPVAPFELLRLRPRENGPYLGLDRPVLRWTDKPPMPDVATLHIAGLACIRPEYDMHEALPSAAAEERDLTTRFAHLPIDRVATLAEFESLLQKDSIQLIHFAGHADGNPARLSLQDGKIEPTYFDPGTPLMNAGPFLFLNGCRAATGRTQVPEFQANMMKLLLAANCTGAVAPLTKVESEAALLAARTFYDAVARRKTVGEAVQAVRALAFASDAPPKNAVSYLSYLAFAPPKLQLAFDENL